MKIDRLVRSQTVAETRAVALAGDIPVAVFAESWLEPPRVRLGEIYSARIRTSDAREGGLFVELESGEAAFMRGAMPKGLSEGSEIHAQVASEARDDKLARVVRTEQSTSSMTPLEAWRERLPDTEGLVWDEDNGQIDDAFDEALAASVTLPTGGRLHISPTRALTAIDIDTAGRKARTSPSKAAHAVNLDAVREAARQLALRGLGGLVVIDCIAPLPRAIGTEIKAAFLERFRAINPRKVEALTPSPFGLLEARLAWGERPISALYSNPMGTLLLGIRALEREAKARPHDSLVLALPADAYKQLGARHGDLLDALNAVYGARFAITQAVGQTTEIAFR